MIDKKTGLLIPPMIDRDVSKNLLSSCCASSIFDIFFGFVHLIRAGYIAIYMLFPVNIIHPEQINKSRDFIKKSKTPNQKNRNEFVESQILNVVIKFKFSSPNFFPFVVIKRWKKIYSNKKSNFFNQEVFL